MNLETIEKNHQEWLIEEFTEVANQLLPQYLPENKKNNKVKEEINPRLIRHYTTLKLIDEPHRQNRYAFYNYRHLLQLLLVRRLLSEGIGASAINDLLTSKTNEELKSLLLGGISINISTAHQYPKNTNSALEYLTNLRQKKTDISSKSSPSIASFTNQKESPIFYNQNISENQISFSDLQKWIHLPVLDGLELHIRDDFVYPNSLQEQDSLNQHLIHILTQYLGRKNHDQY
jgi:DNA-binding transcriptional MerR regulator